MNETVRPAITPSCTVMVPAFSGRFTDARGLGVAVTWTPPETLRLPVPETVQISFGCNWLRSVRSPGITKFEIVWANASPSVG